MEFQSNDDSLSQKKTRLELAYIMINPLQVKDHSWEDVAIIKADLEEDEPSESKQAIYLSVV